jgi:hypothetical protein
MMKGVYETTDDDDFPMIVDCAPDDDDNVFKESTNGEHNTFHSMSEA